MTLDAPVMPPEVGADSVSLATLLRYARGEVEHGCTERNDGDCEVCRAIKELSAMLTPASMKMRPDILTSRGFYTDSRAGHYFDFVKPHTCDVSIAEIAHSLSHLCRFVGHVRTFYSVAQHSYFASFLVPRAMALEALLHDAHEAFVGDTTSPLKQLLPDYRRVERRVEPAVLGQFGITLPLPPEVKLADLVLLATEQRDLMPPHEDEWASLGEITPLADAVVPFSSVTARALFLARFEELVAERAKGDPSYRYLSHTLLDTLPEEHALRTAPLMEIAAQTAPRGGKAWKDIKEHWAIARCCYNELGPAWTTQWLWRATRMPYLPSDPRIVV